MRLDKYDDNYEHGLPVVRHMGLEGYICANGFDHKDAQVVCKESGYAGGISYDSYDHQSGITSRLHWLSNVDCNGDESFLIRCNGLDWGNMTGCNVHVQAAVFCYRQTGLSSAFLVLFPYIIN